MKLQTPMAQNLATSVVFLTRGACRIGNSPGVLKVVEGVVWLSRRGDIDDYVLRPGQEFRLETGDDAVMEPWRPGQTVRVDWQADPQHLRLRDLRESLFAPARSALAALPAWTGLTRLAGVGLAALARSAASSARRAQTSINAGESMASCGALK